MDIENFLAELKVICEEFKATLDNEPPISVSLFSEKSGLSEVTLWRYRQKGWIKTHNIAGRQYISRADVAEFNRRMKAGEFASEPKGCAAKSTEGSQG